MLNSDLLLRPDFSIGDSHYFINVSSIRFQRKQSELTHMLKKPPAKTISLEAHCHTEVNTKATEVFRGFIYRLMCSRSQQIHDQVVTRMKTRRNSDKFVIMAFCGGWLLLLYRGVCGCTVGARSIGIVSVNSFTETDFVQNFSMSRATSMFVFTE